MTQPSLIPAPPGLVAVYVDATGDRHEHVVCALGPAAADASAWAAYVIESGTGLVREAAALSGFVGVLGAGRTLEQDAPQLVAKATELAKSFGEDARLALEDLKETRAGTTTDDLRIREFIDKVDRDG